MPKKTNNKKDRDTKDKIMKEIHKIGDEVTDLVKSVKEKYGQADDKTKKQVLAGLAGAAALIAGAIGYKKMKKKKK
ncbi:MAG: hypothetical protein ABIG60_01595 [Patescibacteria group bacterium]